MVRSITILIRFFSVSMTLFRENSRLIPCKGLRRLNFGLMDSPLTRNLVWAKVAATAHRMATPTTGPTVLPMATRPWTASSPDSPPTSCSPPPMASKHRRRNLAVSSANIPVTSQRVAKVPSRLATATASLLIKTLPFFRSSRRFFGVAFSVLFPSANVHPPLAANGSPSPPDRRGGSGGSPRTANRR